MITWPLAGERISKKTPVLGGEINHVRDLCSKPLHLCMWNTTSQLSSLFCTEIENSVLAFPFLKGSLGYLTTVVLKGSSFSSVTQSETVADGSEIPHPIPQHLLCKAHITSLTLNIALDERCDKSNNKTDHAKPGDKGMKHFGMKLMAERSLRCCSDALRSNPSPFFLDGLLIFILFYFLQGNFIKIDLVLWRYSKCPGEKQIKSNNTTNGNKLHGINWSGAQKEPPTGG